MDTERFNAILDKIENELDGDISFRAYASELALSLYDFRRVFAFVVGVPVSEYVRLRRLSRAVFDLKTTKDSVTEIAFRYGYASSSAFSRAFQEMQGISPTEARKPEAKVTIYPRASLKLTVTSGQSVSFRLIQRPAMKLCGYSAVSHATGSDCCDDVWAEYYRRGTHDDLIAGGMFTDPWGEYAAYENGDEQNVRCTIGAVLPADSPTPEGCTELTIPAALWGVFEIVGSMPEQVNEAYDRIVTDWLPSSVYDRDPAVCNLESFPVEETQENATMRWHIWYPLTPKTQNRNQKGIIQ